MGIVRSLRASFAVSVIVAMLGVPVIAHSAPASPVIASPGVDSLHPAQVNVRGTSEAGTQVQIKEGPATISQAIAAADGTFSMQLVFKGGQHTISAIALDAGGSVSPSSAPVSFTVDNTAPAVSITTGDLTPFYGPPRIQGRATDNVGIARVDVQVSNALGSQVGQAQATIGNPSGLITLWWAQAPSGTGLFTVRVTSYDIAGNRSATRSIRILVIAG